jgi:hypothetical protein
MAGSVGQQPKRQTPPQIQQSVKGAEGQAPKKGQTGPLQPKLDLGTIQGQLGKLKQTPEKTVEHESQKKRSLEITHISVPSSSEPESASDIQPKVKPAVPPKPAPKNDSESKPPEQAGPKVKPEKPPKPGRLSSSAVERPATPPRGSLEVQQPVTADVGSLPLPVFTAAELAGQPESSDSSPRSSADVNKPMHMTLISLASAKQRFGVDDRPEVVFRIKMQVAQETLTNPGEKGNDLLQALKDVMDALPADLTGQEKSLKALFSKIKPEVFDKSPEFYDFLEQLNQKTINLSDGDVLAGIKEFATKVSSLTTLKLQNKFTKAGLTLKESVNFSAKKSIGELYGEGVTFDQVVGTQVSGYIKGYTTPKMVNEKLKDVLDRKEVVSTATPLSSELNPYSSDDKQAKVMGEIFSSELIYQQGLDVLTDILIFLNRNTPLGKDPQLTGYIDTFLKSISTIRASSDLFRGITLNQDQQTILNNPQQSQRNLVLDQHQMGQLGDWMTQLTSVQNTLAYSQYSAGYTSFLGTLKKEFPEVIQAVNDSLKSLDGLGEKNPGKLDFSSFLIMPAQRLPRYEMLFADFGSKTAAANMAAVTSTMNGFIGFSEVLAS